MAFSSVDYNGFLMFCSPIPRIQNAHSNIRWSVKRPLSLNFNISSAKYTLLKTDKGVFNLSRSKAAESVNQIKEDRTVRTWDTLHDYPKEDLLGKTVLVRLDLSFCIKDVAGSDKGATFGPLPTLSYLSSAGVKLVIASHWDDFGLSNEDSNIEHILDFLCRHLEKTVLFINAVRGDAVQDAISNLAAGDVLLLGNLKQHKEEISNNKEFSKDLAQSIDILVNDAFSISHRIFASTVGVACFTSATLAGFQLDRELYFWSKAINNQERPFVAIIGGSRLSDSLTVMYKMLETCSSLIVMGPIVFTFLRALGYRFPSNFIENTLMQDVQKVLSLASAKSVDVIVPIDLLCSREGVDCSTFRADNVPEGWTPIAVGWRTLKTIENLLLLSKTAIWVGSVSLSSEVEDSTVPRSLAKLFCEISINGCTTVVGGRQASLALRNEDKSKVISHVSIGGAAVMEILKGKRLPAISALDFACPGELNWERIYKNPHLPLAVDVGCGNGVFIFRMAKNSTGSMNMLGIEVRRKLVDQCMKSVIDNRLPNVYFVEADAGRMLKRIVSSYPGKVVLITIQCPVPNFNNTESRRTMLQRQLIQHILHIIGSGAKIFLQSDVKEVAMQLKDNFLAYGKDRLRISIDHGNVEKCDSEGWLLDNPLGFSSDWEDHVLLQGKRMYRVLLCCS
ncbi:hypothetical protein KP509_02G069300 [Ceratopteris richardii]|uniref:Phosphoglycerate kinase n=1 Tax=Ceratopteris richardii TaxID=49495 RepID=A0A8T2VIB0_CERRI|nr:hypothetical protein KP509_02G069300 [Ceratopteris richardii]